MKHRFSLAQKLTLFIAITVVAQIAATFIFLFYYFVPGITSTTAEIAQRASISNAQMFASKWTFDIYTSQQENLLNNISLAKKYSPSITALSIFSINDTNNKEPSKLLPEDFTELASEAQKNININKLFEHISNFETPTSSIEGDNVFGGVPVIVEDNLIGYLIYAESISNLNKLQKELILLFALLLIFVSMLQLVAIFFVGTSSSKPIKLLADTAARIADGNLTEQIKKDKSAVYETALLSDAIENMSKAIREQVILIKTLTKQSSDVSKDLAKAMAQLSASASEQAAAVSQTASTVEEIEKTGKSVTEGVKRIVEAADRSAEASERGTIAVNSASSIMMRIKEDSGNMSQHSRVLLSNVEEVGNIINSVNSIAEQSKILAVNASIEAAKAGEWGAGFAVVAQEVKSLAGQSKEATEQITNTLTSIRQSIEAMVKMARTGESRTTEGVTSIANTGALVSDLSDAIEEASEVANEINSSVSQQSIGLSQIASAMEEINSSASEYQDISIKIEASTLLMTKSLEELSALVEIWNTDESTEDEDN